MNRRNLLIAVMSAAGVAVAQKAPAAPAQQDKFTLANENVKKLLLLMDSDKSGKVSKHEWISFMEAEFDRLDRDGSGELDLNELRQSSFLISRPRS